MTPNKNWILYLAAVISMALALVGGITYPQMDEQGPFDAVVYMICIPIIVILLLLLIYYRGLPNSARDASKQTNP